MTKEQIIEEAMRLDEREREQVVETLRLTINHGTPEEIEKRWADEAERRLDDILNGTSKTLDGPEFMKNLRQSRG
jgi:putative addiction module component (TIGR02574 family)